MRYANTGVDDDLAGLEGRFVHLATIDEVAQRFALPVKPDTAWYEGALRQDRLREALGLAAMDLLAGASDEVMLQRRPYTGIRESPWGGRAADPWEPEVPETDQGQPIEWRAWADTPSVEASSVSDAKSYEIGGQRHGHGAGVDRVLGCHPLSVGPTVTTGCGATVTVVHRSHTIVAGIDEVDRLADICAQSLRVLDEEPPDERWTWRKAPAVGAS